MVICRMTIDLRSDFISRPTQKMIEAMNRAAAMPCSFGLRESPIQRQLEALAAEMLGKEDSLFFPTCSMCNQTAINIYCSPGDLFIAESESHCVLSEGGAPAAVSGVSASLVPGERGAMPVANLERAVQVGDELRSRTALIVLENTHNRSGGTILNESRMKQYYDLAKAHCIPVHLDGARLFNAAVGLGIPAADLARYADSVSVSLNKGLSAPLGAMLAGDRAFIAEALKVRQRLGGGWRPTDILAAAGIIALERMVERLAEDHTRARRLAEGIADCPFIHVDLDTVQTNLVIARIEHGRYGVKDFITRLEENGILAIGFGAEALRMALHREIGDSDVDRVIEVLTR